MCSFQEFGMPEAAEGALPRVRLKNPLAKQRLVDSLPNQGFDVATLEDGILRVLKVMAPRQPQITVDRDHKLVLIWFFSREPDRID
jgi:hypothetical protein